MSLAVLPEGVGALAGAPAGVAVAFEMLVLLVVKFDCSTAFNQEAGAARCQLQRVHTQTHAHMRLHTAPPAAMYNPRHTVTHQRARTSACVPPVISRSSVGRPFKGKAWI